MLFFFVCSLRLFLTLKSEQKIDIVSVIAIERTIALSSFGRETLEVHRENAKAKMMFNVSEKLGPKSLTNLFTKKREITNYDLV